MGHRYRTGFPVLWVGLILGIPDQAVAQGGILSELEGLDKGNAQPYVEPLARGLVLAMAGGLFDTATPLKALGFDLGARVSGALPPSEATTFQAVLPESITWGDPQFGGTFEDPLRPAGGDRETPTLVGEGAGIVLEPDGEFRGAILASGEDPSNFTLALPRGHAVPAVPYPVLHASLGVGLGTDMSLRFIPEFEVDEEIGRVKGIGFAVRHALTNWFASPVDVSILLAMQSIDVGTYLDSSSTQYGLMASRQLGPLSLFVSGLLRSGTAEISYQVNNPGSANPALPDDGTSIRFSEELESDSAFGIGARLQLLIMNVAGQYTFEDYSVVTLKVGFGTR